MQILVIDDYRPHGESLAELLDSRGHRALYAPSYEDAEGYFEAVRFDMAFLDFDMPRETGPIVAVRLSERFPRLKSIIVSARARDPRFRNEVGTLPYLEKPVTLIELLDCIRCVERELVGLALARRDRFELAPAPAPVPAPVPVRRTNREPGPAAP